jgi:general secretion pathway protein L
MLFDFFTWWLRQLRSLWPARFHRAAPDAVIVAIDRLEDDPVTATGSILLRRAGLETFAASLDLARPRAGALPALATGLRLPDEMVLHREVTLPLAAERDLAAVLGFEMDRLTPFDAGEVFWGVSRLRRDAERGMLLLTLLVVLRRPVEALADALGRVDLRPAFLESAAGRIELGAPARAGGGRWRWPAWRFR